MSARRAFLALSFPLLAGALAAQDVGSRVAFDKSGGASFAFEAAPTPGGVLYDSGESRPLSEDWDTVLFQGTSPDPGVAFEVSRRDAAGAWLPWVPAEARRYPQGRFWAKSKLGSGPGSLRIRALDRGVAKSHAVAILSVEAFAVADDEKAPPAKAKPGQPAPAAPVAPSIHARAEWKAREPKEAYTPMPAPYRLTLHHTSGPQTRTLAASLDEVRFIQDFHMDGRGWSDIAYHFLIDGAGNVFEGRPEGVQGAHTKNNNEGNLGVVLLGTYNSPQGDVVTKPELEALISLGRWLVSRHGIDPATLRGHRDYKDTDCPGDRAYALIPRLKEAFKPAAPKPSKPLAAAVRLQGAGRIRWDGGRTAP